MVPENCARRAALGAYLLRTSLPTGSKALRPNEMTQVASVSRDRLSIGARLAHVVQSLISGKSIVIASWPYPVDIYELFLCSILTEQLLDS
jgi:hypothetical protein